MPTFIPISSKEVTFKRLLHTKVTGLAFLMLLLTVPSKAQLFIQQLDSLPRPIQFSGLVVDEDTGQPMPFVTILIKNRVKGTITDNRGFFSFVALIGDTIRFSSLGYKKAFLVIPDTIIGNSWSVVQPMEADPITLKPIRVWPWANKEQFKQEFMAAQLPDEKAEIAKRNLEAELLAELSGNLSMDGYENQRNFIQNEIQKTYFAGQMNFAQLGGPNAVPIPSTLLSPIAWAEFVKALQRGDFWKKKKRKLN